MAYYECSSREGPIYLYKNGSNFDVEGASPTYLHESNGVIIRDTNVSYKASSVTISGGSYAYGGLLSKTAYDLTNKSAFGFKSDSSSYWGGDAVEYKHSILRFILCSKDKRTIPSINQSINIGDGNYNTSFNHGILMSLEGITGSYYVGFYLFSQTNSASINITDIYLV